MLRLIIVGVLLFRLTPVGGELLEALISMGSGGDHVGCDHDATDPEHGCSALVHHCACHSSVGDVREVTIAFALPRQLRGAEFVLTSPQLAPDPQSLLRPPAA